MDGEAAVAPEDAGLATGEVRIDGLEVGHQGFGPHAVIQPPRALGLEATVGEGLADDASTFAKVIWILVILLLSFLGFVIWLIFGPKTAKKSD